MTAYATDDLEPSPIDERVAPTYDAGSAHMFAPAVLGPTVDVLHELAGEGPAFFVVEVFVPQLRRMPPGQTAVPFHVGSRRVGFDTVDVVSQRSVSHHDVRKGQQDAQGRELARYAASAHRYVWPSELDLMACIASLTLTHRWADWDHTPFTAASESHVSVSTKGGA